VEERRLAVLAADLGLTAEELQEVEAAATPGLAELLVGGLIRFEDALFELSQ
jgi:hypothetical protein